MSKEKPQPEYVSWYDHNPVGRKMTDYTGAHPDTGEILPSMTKQSFKDECDINNIIAQYKPHEMTMLVQAAAAQGQYLDLPDVIDLQDAFAITEKANAAFMSLPAIVRDRFNNDPTKFLAFVDNPANGDELIKLGLREPPPPQGPRAAAGARQRRRRNERRGGRPGEWGRSPVEARQGRSCHRGDGGIPRRLRPRRGQIRLGNTPLPSNLPPAQRGAFSWGEHISPLVV